jgi:hypothetical protein
MPLCHLLISICCKAIVLDSLLFTVNSDIALVSEISFPEPIIDYVSDEFLYLSTSDCLYKIDPSEPSLVDKTPLPLRFNHLLLKAQEIILIATNEIIILDRDNLAFKSGIGIEPGDFRPIIKDQSFASLSVNNNIYLVSDVGKRSHLRIIDLRSGRLVRKMSIDRLKSFVYDTKTQSFIGLDVKNNVLIYDEGMNRIRKINLEMEATHCSTHPDGLLIHSDQGIILMNAKGAVIDFQPIPIVRVYAGLVVLKDDAIIGLDSVTLRPNDWMSNRHNIDQIYPCAYRYHAVGVDVENNFYLLDQDPLAVLPMKKNIIQLKERPQLATIGDSLWYLQLGAFSDPINALHTSKELREQGLPVFIDSTDLYRIKFGGFIDKFAALSIIEKMKIEGWFVYQRRMPSSRSEEFYVGTERYIIENGVVRKEQ